MTHLHIKLKPNSKNNISWQLTTFSLLKSQFNSSYQEEGPWRGRVQRWPVGTTCPRLPLFMARIYSRSFSFTSSKVECWYLTNWLLASNMLLLRCASCPSNSSLAANLESGDEDEERRERKSKMFDTVFVPKDWNTPSITHNTSTSSRLLIPLFRKERKSMMFDKAFLLQYCEINILANFIIWCSQIAKCQKCDRVKCNDNKS